MSGLAGLLSGDRTPGVYRWAGAEPVDEVGHACAVAGWSFGAVDGWTVPGRTGLLRSLGLALAFPDWYGENFDALADCLSDLTAPTVLLWDGWGPLAREDPQSYVIAVDVLAARTATPATTGPPFAVLLRGEGPEVDPPWL